MSESSQPGSGETLISTSPSRVALVDCKRELCEATLQVVVPESVQTIELSEIRIKCWKCGQTSCYKTTSRSSFSNMSPSDPTEIVVDFVKMEEMWKRDTRRRQREREKQQKEAEQKRKAARSDNNVADTEYYDLLEVPTSATSAEIKKAYYRLSLACHPDKTGHLDEKEKKLKAEHFRRISEAYTTLSDSEKRAIYDKHGKDRNMTQLAEFDPSEFFKFSFGGDEFVPLFGELELGRSFKEAMDMVIKSDSDRSKSEEDKAKEKEMNDLRQKESDERHSKRIAMLCENLKARLAVFTESYDKATRSGGGLFDFTQRNADPEEFVEAFKAICTEEMKHLSMAPSGPQLLRTLGYIYSLKAEQNLAKLDSEQGNLAKRVVGFSRRVSSNVKEKTYIFKETVGTFRTAMEWHNSMTKLAEQDQEGTQEDTEESGDDDAGDETSKSKHKSESNSKSSAKKKASLTEEQKRALEQETATKSQETLWRGIKLEIESVVREVCDAILKEGDREDRRRRCVALSIMGDVFMSAKNLDATDGDR